MMLELTSNTSDFRIIQSLINGTGAIATVLNVKVILSIVEKKIEIILLNSDGFNWQSFFGDFATSSSWVNINLIKYQDDSPSFVDLLKDGTRVNFDAIRTGPEDNFKAISVWIGQVKPSIIVGPFINISYILYNKYVKVQAWINFMIDDENGYLSFNRGNEIIQMKFTKRIFTDAWEYNIILKILEADIYELRTASSFSAPHYICTSLRNTFSSSSSLSAIDSKFNLHFNKLYNKNGVHLPTLPGSLIHCDIKAKFSLVDKLAKLNFKTDEDDLYFNWPQSPDLKREFPVLSDQCCINVRVHAMEIRKMNSRKWRILISFNESNYSCNVMVKDFVFQCNDSSDNISSDSIHCIQHPIQPAVPVVPYKNNLTIPSIIQSNPIKPLVLVDPIICQVKNIDDEEISKNNFSLSSEKSFDKKSVIDENQNRICLIHSEEGSVDSKKSQSSLSSKCYARDNFDVDTSLRYFFETLPMDNKPNEKLNNVEENAKFLSQFLDKPSSECKIIGAICTSTVKVPSDISNFGRKILLGVRGSIFKDGIETFIIYFSAGVPVLIPLQPSFLDEWQRKKKQFPAFYWRNRIPCELSKLQEKMEVSFDAVVSSNQMYYKLILLWVGLKPTFIPFCKPRTFFLTEKLVKINMTVLKFNQKSLFLSFTNGEECHNVCKIRGLPVNFEKKIANNELVADLNKLISPSRDESFYYTCDQLFRGKGQQIYKCEHFEFDCQYRMMGSFFEKITTHDGLHLDVEFFLKYDSSDIFVDFVVHKKTVSHKMNCNFTKKFNSDLGMKGIGHILVLNLNQAKTSYQFLIATSDKKINLYDLVDYGPFESTSMLNEESFDERELLTNSTVKVYNNYEILTDSLEKQSEVKLHSKNLINESVDMINEMHINEVPTVNLIESANNIICDPIKTTNGNDVQSLLSEKLPSHGIALTSVLRNVKGSLEKDQYRLVVKCVLKSRIIKVNASYDGYIFKDGVSTEIKKFSLPQEVFIDAFYDDKNDRYKVTAIWIGKNKPKTMMISAEETRYLDVICRMRSFKQNNLLLDCILDKGQRQIIRTYETKRIFNENGQVQLKDLANYFLIANIKKTVNPSKTLPKWQILMMIQINDNVLRELFPSSMSIPLTYDLLIIEQMGKKKQQVAEINKHWEIMGLTNFNLIFGKIVVDRSDIYLLDYENDQRCSRIKLDPRIFLDTPLLQSVNCDQNENDVCIVSLPQPQQNSFKMLLGFRNDLCCNNCYILVNFVQQPLETNVVRLISQNSEDNKYFITLLDEKVIKLVNYVPNDPIYFLVRDYSGSHNHPKNCKITKQVLLASNNWELCLMTMMLYAKEFINKVQALRKTIRG